MNRYNYPNMEQQNYDQAAEFNYFQLHQNWSTGVLRAEAALINELATGKLHTPDYVKDTETQREFQNPAAQRPENMKHIGEQRLGRYAYSQNRSPPNGILPTFNAQSYPEVVPRFHLPKMPY